VASTPHHQVGTAGHRTHHGRDVPGFRHGVGVEEAEHRTPTGRRPEVAGGRGPEPPVRLGHDPHRVGTWPGLRLHPGTVVGDDDLEGGVVLEFQRGQHEVQTVRVLEVGHHDRDERGPHAGNRSAIASSSPTVSSNVGPPGPSAQLSSGVDQTSTRALARSS
jgi:hypothetical protein